MKLHAAFCLLLMAGCATVPSPHSGERASGNVGPAGDVLPAPVRMETPAGTFLVHPRNVEDFSKLLAGEPAGRQYFADADVP